MLDSRSVYQRGDVACDESPRQRLSERPPKDSMEVLHGSGGKSVGQFDGAEFIIRSQKGAHVRNYANLDRLKSFRVRGLGDFDGAAVPSVIPESPCYLPSRWNSDGGGRPKRPGYDFLSDNLRQT